MNEVTPGSIYLGDCLDIMSRWDSDQVDLIYLDPPFNSDAKYNILFGKETNGKSSQYMAFEDTWEWNEDAVRRVASLKLAIAHPARNYILAMERVLGDCGMLSYLSYMAERLYECYRTLKTNGSIYLHCDPTASHYLKLLMDEIFGGRNFRNEIIWCYWGPSNAKRWFPKKHDVILFYSKSKKWTFNFEDAKIPYSDETLARRGRVEGEKSIIAGSVGNQKKKNVQPELNSEVRQNS